MFCRYGIGSFDLRKGQGCKGVYALCLVEAPEHNTGSHSIANFEVIISNPAAAVNSIGKVYEKSFHLITSYVFFVDFFCNV